MKRILTTPHAVNRIRELGFGIAITFIEALLLDRAIAKRRIKIGMVVKCFIARYTYVHIYTTSTNL